MEQPITQHVTRDAVMEPEPDQTAAARPVEIWRLDFGGHILAGPKCQWCNADSWYAVARYGVLSGQRLVSNCCERHARAWMAAAGYESLDEIDQPERTAAREAASWAGLESYVSGGR
jgi:hypothetical protein